MFWALFRFVNEKYQISEKKRRKAQCDPTEKSRLANKEKILLTITTGEKINFMSPSYDWFKGSLQSGWTPGRSTLGEMSNSKLG